MKYFKLSAGVMPAKLTYPDEGQGDAFINCTAYIQYDEKKDKIISIIYVDDETGATTSIGKKTCKIVNRSKVSYIELDGVTFGPLKKVTQKEFLKIIGVVV